MHASANKGPLNLRRREREKERVRVRGREQLEGDSYAIRRKATISAGDKSRLAAAPSANQKGHRQTPPTRHQSGENCLNLPPSKQAPDPIILPILPSLSLSLLHSLSVSLSPSLCISLFYHHHLPYLSLQLYLSLSRVFSLPQSLHKHSR